MTQELIQTNSASYYLEGSSSAKEIALIFQGQGKYEVEAGRDLYNQFPRVAAFYDTVTEILGYSPLELTPEQIAQTSFVQPAIFAYNEACRMALPSPGKNATIKYCAGSSLGEINALFAAGAFDLWGALVILKARGEGMQIASDMHKGDLAAFLVSSPEGSAPTKAQIRELERNTRYLTGNKGRVYLEAVNSDTQVVFGGLEDDLNAAEQWYKKAGLSKKGLIFKRLHVAGPFHSKYMEPAVPYLVDALGKIHIKETSVPVIANTTARPISKPAEIKEELVRHLTMPVLWKDSMDYITHQGVEATLEVGKRPLLSNLMRGKGKMITMAVAGVVTGAAVGIGTLLYFQNKEKK